nr:farnesylcysteine lyase [Quercus suber]
MATVNVSGQTFEAGASILHPKNYYAVNYTQLLGLKNKDPPSDSFSLGIWDGQKFVFKTHSFSSKIPFVDKIASLANLLLMFVRYGFSILKMQTFVEGTVNNFLKYYERFESRPVFETVDEMLKWAGLYNLTTRTLQEELIDVGLSPLLIKELVTVTTRINYGQSASISGLAGAVSLAGSGGGVWAIEGGNWQMAAGLINRSDAALHLHEEIDSVSYLGEYYELNSTKGNRSGGGVWAIEGGNWQMAAGLINRSDAALHLHEEIDSVSYLGEYYELNSTKGNSYKCEVAVVATPLDELNIQFTPPISIPKRKLQHTHATFVRGLLNPGYFGLDAVSEIPKLVATLEDPDLPFTSISVLKKHDEKDFTYKIFSREPMADILLDSFFSVRQETIRIDWGAYPHYNAPEEFAPFILDDRNLYYVNAFENAASTVETSAVAAENIARLILSRFFSRVLLISSNLGSNSDGQILHVDL